MSEIHERRTLKDLEELIQEEELVKKYKLLRPYLSRLFTHLLVLIVAIRAYLNFLESISTYDALINELSYKSVVDIIKIESSQSCPIEMGYEEITKAKFPKINAGCRCDKVLYTSDLCANLTKLTDPENSTHCEFQDAVISQTLSSSITIPNTYSQSEIEEITKLIKYSRSEPSQLRLLSSIMDGKFKQNLPGACFCYEDIPESAEFEIGLFFKNERICIKKHGNLTSLNYLQSALIDNCDEELKCQKYFCKSSKEDVCPLVDAWLDNQDSSIFPGNQEIFIYDNVSEFC